MCSASYVDSGAIECYIIGKISVCRERMVLHAEYRREGNLSDDVVGPKWSINLVDILHPRRIK